MTTTVELIIGILYIFLWLILSSSYALSLVAICTDRTLREMSCYKIMFSVGVCDIGQVFILALVSAIFILSSTDGTGLVGKIIGGILNGLWYLSTVLSAALAFNRFLVMFSDFHYDVCFKGWRVYICLGVCYAYGLVLMVCYLILPKLSFGFSRDYYYWVYDNSTLSQEFETFNMVSDLSTMCVVVIFYAALLIQMCAKMRANSCRNQRHFKEERRALVPAFVIALNFVLIDVYYYVIPYLSTDQITVLLTNLIWTVCIGNNGLLNIVFNQSVRKQVIKVIERARNNQVGSSNKMARKDHVLSDRTRVLSKF